MRNRWTKNVLILATLSAALAAGCAKEEATETKQTDENQQSAENEKIKNDMDESSSFYHAPMAPKTYEEVLAYPNGEMAGKQFETKKEEFERKLNQFPALSEQAAEEEVESVYNKLVQLYKQDYPHPPTYTEQGSSEKDEAQVEQMQELAYNVEIILDASGSMAGKVGNQTKMELAKKSIRDFSSSLPEGAHVGMRVYGHKGTNEEQDKLLSCESSELVYDVSTYNNEQLERAMASFQSTGWTPMAKSLEEAGKDLSEFQGEHNQNIIYLVSDGIETCGGNPVEAAKQLKESNIAPVVNVIGFDVGEEGKNQLQQVASAAEGTYATVTNQQELIKEFEKAKEHALNWYEWANEERQKTFDTKMTNYDALNEYRLTSKKLANEERMNYNKSLDYLFNQKKITWEQKTVLLELHKSYFKMIETATDEIYSNHIHKNSDEYFEQINEISEKVKENTN